MTYRTLEISKDHVRNATLTHLQSMGLVPKGMNILTEDWPDFLKGDDTISVKVGLDKEKGVKTTVRQ